MQLIVLSRSSRLHLQEYIDRGQASMRIDISSNRTATSSLLELLPQALTVLLYRLFQPQPRWLPSHHLPRHPLHLCHHWKQLHSRSHLKTTRILKNHNVSGARAFGTLPPSRVARAILVRLAPTAVPALRATAVRPALHLPPGAIEGTSLCPDPPLLRPFLPPLPTHLNQASA